MKNFLAKIIMKDKELYLSTRYNIFGRNESLSLEKDIISIYQIYISFSK